MSVKVTTSSDEASYEGDSVAVEDGVLFVRKTSASGYPDTVAVYAPGTWDHAEVKE